MKAPKFQDLRSVLWVATGGNARVLGAGCASRGVSCALAWPVRRDLCDVTHVGREHSELLDPAVDAVNEFDVPGEERRLLRLKP